MKSDNGHLGTAKAPGKRTKMQCGDRTLSEEVRVNLGASVSRGVLSKAAVQMSTQLHRDTPVPGTGATWRCCVVWVLYHFLKKTHHLNSKTLLELQRSNSEPMISAASGPRKEQQAPVPFTASSTGSPTKAAKSSATMEV